MAERASCGVTHSRGTCCASRYVLSQPVACDEGSMMSGGCGALRMTMAFSLESLSAGSPCDFHLVGLGLGLGLG